MTSSRILVRKKPVVVKRSTLSLDSMTMQNADEDSIYNSELNSNKIGIVVLLVASLLPLILSVFFIYAGVDSSSDWSVRIMAATLAWIIIYLACIYHYHRTLYLFSNAYLLALSMFHLGLIYTIALNQEKMAFMASGKISALYELSGWYVALSLSAFGIGTAIAILTKTKSKYTNKQMAYFKVKTNQFLFKQGVGLGIATIIFLILAISSYGNIFAYSRAEIFNLTLDSRGFGVFIMVFPGAVSLLALSAQSKKQKLFSYSLAVFIVLVVMLSGYRSAALFPTLVVVIIWVKSGRKIPVAVAISGILLVLLSISVISTFRMMGSYEKLSAEDLATSYEQASISDSFLEMGSSVGVLAEVLKLVPETEPYRYGYSYWMSLKEMVPNLGFSIDSSKSRKVILGEAQFDQDALIRMAPADWITYRINRWKFDNGQGVGFSAIAEPYLNFGTIGVVAYFLLLGFILARLDLKVIICHPYLYLFSAAIFWHLLKTVRNDYSNFTKPLGFIIVVLIIWNIGLHILGKHTKFGNSYDS